MSVFVVVVLLDDEGLLEGDVVVVVLEPGVLPLGLVVVVVELSVDGVVVLLVVVDDEELPVAGAAVGAGLGVTSTLVLEDDEGGVLLVVSVLEQPTTPTPTARRAARRYDGFIFRFPSFGG